MGEDPSELGLEPAWRAWVVRALLDHTPPREVAFGLMAEGIPDAIATREVGILADGLAEVGPIHLRSQLVLRLLSAADRPIERRRLCDRETFRARYFSVMQPVLFTDGCAAMPATSWTLDALTERAGLVALDLQAGAMTFADAICQTLSPSTGSPVIRANDAVLAGPLAALTTDLAPVPELLDADRAASTANLWMGPAGTRTPLHHDTTPVLLCQLVGRKRVRLVAPWHPAVVAAPMLDRGESGFDLDEPGDVPVHELVVVPGEALFVPAGWWHEVTALDAAITATLRAFPWPSDYGWYRPDAAR